MRLFGQIVRTAVNVVGVPVAIVHDVFTLGGICTEQDDSYTRQAINILKTEASEGPDLEDIFRELNQR